MSQTPRNIALITGANGGMGRSVLRQIGATQDLVLTDIASDPLQKLAASLRDEGYAIAGVEAGDLADPALLSRLTASCEGRGPLTLVHTAGLSPAQADWQKIIHVNIAATQRLLDAIEPVLVPGSVGVLIASMAGHSDIGMPEADRLLEGTIGDATLGRLRAILFHDGKSGDEAEKIAAQIAYVLSKRAVIRLCERRAGLWGAKGARIVSVSPGLIYTPMGVLEAETDPRTKAGLRSQPINRWGTAMDIAAAVAFLASPAASFITGCDLRVDGGAIAAGRT